MRLLAIDLGGKRTGLAVGDTITRVVSPLRVIEAGPARLDTLVDALAQAVRDHSVQALVLGLPLNMDDSEGPPARDARRMAQVLGERLALPVHLQDERLSSDDADRALARSGFTRAQKKARRDALAAATILREYLASLPPAPPLDAHPGSDGPTRPDDPGSPSTPGSPDRPKGSWTT